MSKLIEAGNKSVLLQEALSLFDQGIKVVLSDATTRRVINPYSEFSPITNRENLEEMCEKYPDANLDIVVDKKNSVVVMGVGIDPGKDNAAISFWKLIEKNGSPNTLAYQLPDGARYYLFKSDIEEPEFDEQSGIHFLKDSDCVYSYPSIIDGQLVERLGDTTIVQNLSDWLAGKGTINLPSQGIDVVETIVEADEATVQEGQPINSEVSNDVATVAGPLTIDTVDTADPISILTQEIKMLAATGITQGDILTHVITLNRSQTSPISTNELVRLVEELSDDQEQESDQPPTGKDLLSKLAETIIPFHDEKREPYFFYEGESFKAPSKLVANRLKYLYLKETGSLPYNCDVKEILDIKETLARFEGELVNLKNRVSAKGQEIYYDMRDKRYLKITPAGWEIVPADFPIFQRYQHMQTQVEPVIGGDPYRVFDFITVSEEDRLLVLVYIISLFVPGIAHPVFALFGEQGASKSFFSSVVNRLVDPTITERIIQPKNERDLIQTVRQKYVTVLDNLSKIDNRVSDIFCQVCTGGSVSLRQLYTDEGENIAQFRHIVILNSISLAIVNADLMDRSIILKLHRIKPEDRKPEQDLWAAFETARPRILGGIFDTIVKAMAIYPTLTLKQLPRLADFAKWGYAIAEALGMSGIQFLDDFSQNIKRQNESVVEKNVLCQTVLRLMSDKPKYFKSVADAHSALKTIAGEDHKDATFPKLPQNLRAGLDVLQSTLAEHDISCEFLDRDNKGVKVLFSKTGTPATPVKNPAIGAPMATFEPEVGVLGVPGEADSVIPEFDFDEIPEAANA